MAYAIAGSSQPDMLDCVEELWPKIDGVILQHATAVALLDAVNLERKPTFYLSHNCEFELATNAHLQTDDHEFAMLMHQLEYRACLTSDVVVPTTTEDREKFVHLYGVDRRNVHVAGNGSVCRFPDDTLPRSFCDPNTALFLGSKWGPNVDAGRFICDTLAPACPGITFHVCGSVCDALATGDLPENVTLHGILEDRPLGNLMASTHIGLNPILGGAGSNVKLADYLAHGMRVVTTPKGMRGFEFDSENIHCVEPQALAEFLNDIARAPAPKPAKRSKWQAATRALWSWDRIGAQLGQRIAEHFDVAPLHPPATSKRIVVLNEFPIKGRQSGGEARISGLLSHPPKDTEVVVVSFGRSGFAIHQLAERVSCIELPATSWQKEQVAQANRYNYTSIDDVIFPETVHRNPMFLAALDCMVTHADAVVLEHPFMFEVYKQIRARAPVIYGSHNVETDMKQVTLDAHRQKHRICDTIRKWERDTVDHAHLVCACSEGDAEVYRSWGATNVEVIENGVTPLSEQMSQEAFEEDRRVYLRREFANLGTDAADQIVTRILKRPPTPEELQESVQALSDGGSKLDLHILKILRGAENMGGPRTYVTGLLTEEKRRPFSAVFLGTSHRPNLSAAELLISFVAPACPDTDFLLVGKVGLSIRDRELPRNVFVTGFVSDTLKSEVMLDCDIGLNPMTEGGGSNLKIPDYLVHGMPVVSTFFGGRGFRFGEDEGLHLTDIMGFSEKINHLNKVKGDSRTRLNVKNGPIADYYWSNLSARYFDLISQVAGFDQDRPILALQNSAPLDAAMLGFDAKPVLDAARAGSKRLLVQTPPIQRATDVPSYFDLDLQHIGFFDHRRELSTSLASTGEFGILNKRLMRVGSSTNPLKHLPAKTSERVQFASNCSAPLYNGNKVHRFIADGARIELPTGCSSLSLSGYALQQVSIRITADERPLVHQAIHKKFTLTMEIDCAETLEIAISGVGASNYFAVSIEDMAITHNSVAQTVQLLHPNFTATNRALDGRPIGQSLPEDRILPTMEKTLHTGRRPVQYIGDDRFRASIQQVSELAEPLSVTQAPPEDWIIGLMSNKRNLVGYRNKLNLGASPLVIVTNSLTSELIAVITSLRDKLQRRFGNVKCTVIVPSLLAESREAAVFSSFFDKKKADVRCLGAESERETLALMAEAGGALVYDVSAAQWDRMYMLADVFDLNVYYWGRHPQDYNTARSLNSIDDFVRAYWQRASNQDWRSSMDLNQLQTPSKTAVAG